MRIATWNINGLNARLDYIRHWLEAVSPDVVGLQELKMQDEKFPHEAFRELGYFATTLGQKSWNGVAILSKKPVEASTRGLPGQEGFGARLISAKVDGVHFATVYCPNGKRLEHDDYGRKLEWFDDLLAWMNAEVRPSDPFVLCGDFNIVPTGLDSWNEERFAGDIFHTDAERERLASIQRWGLMDLWRETYPEEPGHTWWDYRGGAFHRRMGLRIDLILGTASIRTRVEDVFVSRDWRKKIEGLTPSDHAPVWADLSSG